MSATRKVERMLAARNVRGLGRALRDRNTVVRRRAAQALGELRDPAGVPFLQRAMLKDSDEFVRQWALDALRGIGGAAAEDALIAGLFGTDRTMATLAAQALTGLGSVQAITAVSVRDLATRNDWAGLQRLGEEARRALSILLSSDLYATWPSAKRNEVLNLAVRLGATPPTRYRRELAAGGMFVSGVHTIGDLVNGLQHRSPAVRISAAKRLGDAGKKWTTRPLYYLFQRENRPGGDRTVAIAFARAMARLGDLRAVNHYRQRLYTSEGKPGEAARALVEIAMRETMEILFWFVAAPPPPPAYRNVPAILSALEGASADAINQLTHLLDHEQPNVRRLMIEIVARSRHPEAVMLLSPLATDPDQEVQHAALDALSELNSAEAVEALYALRDDAPRRWIARALAVITHPSAPERLREIDPSATTLHGRVLDNRQALQGARVQVVQQRIADKTGEAMWQAISARAEADDQGAFALTVFGALPEAPMQIKVTTPVKPNGKGSEVFTAQLSLSTGKAHQVEARIDRFFERLMLDIFPIEASTPNPE